MNAYFTPNPDLVKPVKRPVSIDGRFAAELGTMLDLEIGEHIVRFLRPKPRLLYFPALHALCWIASKTRKTAAKTTKAAFDEVSAAQRGKASQKLFSTWADRESKKARVETYPKRDNEKWWTWIAPALRLDYRSDKWGKSDEYTHQFGKGVRVYVLPTSKAMLWLVRGGRLTVTARGIVG